MKFQNFVPVRTEFGAGKLETVGSHTKAFGNKALIVTQGHFLNKVVL